MGKIIDKYIVIPGLLSVKSNVKRLPYYSLSTYFSKVRFGDTKVNIQFKEISNLPKPKDLNHKLDFFWGNSGSKKLYYNHPIIFNLRAKMLIEIGDNPSLTVNRSYLMLSRFKFENVWPPGTHLMSLSVISLLLNDMAIIHAGAMATSNGAGVLLFGASNTGKSYTVTSGIKNGYAFMSEDMVGTDGVYIYSCPLLSTFSKILPTKNFLLNLSNKIAAIPFIGLLIPRVSATKPFKKFMQNYKVNDKAPLKYIFILERKKGDTITKISKEEAFKKVLNLNRMELGYFKSDMLYAYSYFNSDFSLGELMKKEEAVIRNLVSKTETYVIKCEDPKEFFFKIDSALQRK